MTVDYRREAWPEICVANALSDKSLRKSLSYFDMMPYTKYSLKYHEKRLYFPKPEYILKCADGNCNKRKRTD